MMNIPITRAAEGLDRRAFTIADLEKMVEAGVIAPEERLELLGGEIVPMSPKGSRHEVIKVALSRRWGWRCPPAYVVAPETGLRLDIRTYLEPDFIVFSRTVRLAEVKGPDILLAVEVADSSLSYDLERKALIYASFGVRELWVIDSARRLTYVHTGPAPNGYAFRQGRNANDHLVPAAAPPELALALDDLEPI